MTRPLDPAKYPSLIYEQALWQAGCQRVAGIDEAGRGAWAGPVCTAVVILPADPSLIQTLPEVRDSKLMTPLARQTWAPVIQGIALAWGVGFASPGEIDANGILPATRLAAVRALLAIDRRQSITDHSSPDLLSDPRPPDYLFPGCLIPDSLFPDYLLTDYLVFPECELPQTALVKGDRLSLSVAAASVLAKTTRDARMRELDPLYSAYGFARHKGYGTRFHQEAIRQFGLSAIHRKSFSISC
jgi:ribonuclease HII